MARIDTSTCAIFNSPKVTSTKSSDAQKFHVVWAILSAISPEVLPLSLAGRGCAGTHQAIIFPAPHLQAKTANSESASGQPLCLLKRGGVHDPEMARLWPHLHPLQAVSHRYDESSWRAVRFTPEGAQGWGSGARRHFFPMGWFLNIRMTGIKLAVSARFSQWLSLISSYRKSTQLMRNHLGVI